MNSLPRRLAAWASIAPALLSFAGAETAIETSPRQQKLLAEFGAKAEAAEAAQANAIPSAEGWLFFAPELRFLAAGQFWGEAAAKVSRSSKPEAADPFPAIVDLHEQLKQRGIRLLCVPVPPKAAIYPEKLAPGAGDDGSAEPVSPFLPAFYAKLRGAGVEVIDLGPQFREQRQGEHGPVFCATDTHWSPAGCVLAARAIAEKLAEVDWAGAAPKTRCALAWEEERIEGDLISLLPASAEKPGPESVRMAKVTREGGGAVEADPASPLLLMGDSHTLVFHDFLGKNSGLLDQLARELGFAPDLLGTRGSGASAVRVNLYRQAARDPAYLAGKKVIVWCLGAREFTEAPQGWPKLPVGK